MISLSFFALCLDPGATAVSLIFSSFSLVMVSFRFHNLRLCPYIADLNGGVFLSSFISGDEGHVKCK